jgi:mycothiol system anti-sigma-R factor
MTCEQVQELIHAHLDGELDSVKIVAVETHLRECENCHSEHRAQSHLRSLVKGSGLRFTAPEILKKRIEEQIQSRRPEPFCGTC